MITTLTPHQTAQLAVYRDKWIGIGLSTERADRATAEAAFTKLYAATKLDVPKVIWVPSPLVGALAAVCIARILLTREAWAAGMEAGFAAAAKAKKNKKAVGSAVGSAVRSAVGSAVDSAVGSAVRSAVRSAVDSAVGSAVDSAVDSAVGSAVDSAVDSAVGSAVDSAGTAFFGGHLWPGYASWAEFMALELAVPIGVGTEYIAATRSCCYWWALKGFVLASERPLVLNRDDLGRLHDEQGPAIAWEDGFALWHWHGQKVPEAVIRHPEQITIASIKAEADAEVRRVMVERFGIGRYLHETGAKLIDLDQVEVVRGSGRTMPRCLLHDKEGNAYLEGTDGSTDRTYFMSVDPAAKTCRQAHESICGLDESRCVAQS